MTQAYPTAGADVPTPRCVERARATVPNEMDTEPHTSSPEPPPEPAGSPAGAEFVAQLQGFAEETTALVAAIGRLASAEASLSLTALTRTVGMRLAGVLLLSAAAAFFAISGTLVLAEWLGSMAAALAWIGGVMTAVAAILLWRAAVWRKRIGFAETRAALSVDAKPSAESHH
jgi:hypothetical protein